MNNTITLKLSDVVYREDLYPRQKHNPSLVQTYADNLDKLPPIEVNQHNILIDGWHRWTAHQQVADELARQGKEAITSILATVTTTPSEAELKILAAERNSQHGWQMSPKDKRQFAIKLYAGTETETRSAIKERLQNVLSVSQRTLFNWLSDIDKATKEEQKKEAYDLWLACYTQDEIAERVGVDQKTVKNWLEDFRKNGKFSEIPKISFQDQDFKPPIYNVWSYAALSNDVTHPGNTEVRLLENLLWLYTHPFDIVIDPFAGGGSTIDVCKKRGRRYYVSDRLPIVSRKDEIRQHDLTDGIPSIPRWKDVALVYLDPPYWRQAENAYSKDPQDLANMPLDEFNETLSGIINSFADKLSGYDHAKYIALIIQPTQWRADDRKYTDHVIDMCNAVDREVHMRYQAPYSNQQCTPQMAQWAADNHRSLVLSREIVVWSIQ